jgi:hypothetical protein
MGVHEAGSDDLVARRSASEDGAERDSHSSTGEGGHVEPGREVEAPEEAAADRADYRDREGYQPRDDRGSADPRQRVDRSCDTDEHQSRTSRHSPTLERRQGRGWRRRRRPGDGEHLSSSRDGQEHGPGEEGMQRSPPRPSPDQHHRRPQDRHEGEDAPETKGETGDGV